MAGYMATFLLVLYRYLYRDLQTFKPWLMLGFLAKCAAGLALGYWYLGVPGADTWYYHQSGLDEYRLLLKDPLRFFTKDLFTHGYSGSVWTRFFDTENSFFNDLQQNLIIKLSALLSLLSGGNYFVNVVLYNILCFGGWVALFRFCILRAVIGPAVALGFLFFFPPLLWWGSGFLKDGLCIALYGWLLLLGNRHSFSAYRIGDLIKCIIPAILLFLLRPFWALILLPMMILSGLIPHKSRNVLLIYPLALLAGMLLFFSTILLPESWQLPQKVADRQAAFSTLEGKSRLALPRLDASADSYLKALPRAFYNAACSPGMDQVTDAFSLLSMVFVWLLGAGVIRFIWLFYKGRAAFTHIQWLLFWICILQLLLIGLTVPFVGAIVRYRALFECFLLMLFWNAGYESRPWPHWSRLFRISQ